jgi:hypothetical protein
MVYVTIINEANQHLNYTLGLSQVVVILGLTQVSHQKSVVGCFTTA